MELNNPRENIEQASGFRFPGFLIRKHGNLCKLFMEKIKSLAPEQFQNDFWKIPKELSVALNLGEIPEEITNCINAYGYHPEAFNQISAIFEQNGITFPLADNNLEAAKKIYELRKQEKYDNTFLFNVFFLPLLAAIQEHQRKKEHEAQLKELDKIEYPEKIRELIALINKFYAASLEQKKGLREQLNQNPAPFRLFTHADLTATFSERTKFKYNIKELFGSEANEGSYLGYNDSGRLYLAPIEEVFFRASRGPDVLDRFFELLEYGETQEEDKGGRGRIKFINLKHPVILSGEGEKDLYRVRQRGVLEIELLE